MYVQLSSYESNERMMKSIVRLYWLKNEKISKLNTLSLSTVLLQIYFPIFIPSQLLFNHTLSDNGWSIWHFIEWLLWSWFDWSLRLNRVWIYAVCLYVHVRTLRIFEWGNDEIENYCFEHEHSHKCNEETNGFKQTTLLLIIPSIGSFSLSIIEPD